MDLFLTEDDYLPAEFDELPLDEAILRVREIDDERPKKKSKASKEKRKRPPDDDSDTNDGERQDDRYVEEDGWLVNDLGDDGYVDEDEEDDDEDGDGDNGEKRPKVYGDDEAEEVDDTGDKKKKKKDEDEEKEKRPRRRVNSAPRVNLNVERLKHINALPALPGILRSLKFKGKGHEEDDLVKIMTAMEHWAHRVMPRLKFDDFIEKAEQLGSKKILKTFVAKMRYNMPLDTIGDIPGKDFEPNDRDTDDEMLFDEELPPLPQVNAEDAFDALMKEAEMVVKQRAAAAVSVANVSGTSSAFVASTSKTGTEPSTSANNNSSSQTTNQTIQSSQNSNSATKQSSLSEEQRKRIAENARKAAEKRLALAMERSKQQDKSFTQ